MAFQGWSEEAIEFYDGLEEDNSKGYWQLHKATYDGAVKRPMEELLIELADEFGAGRIFRPNRDVRFSADKSPYKTAIAAVLDSGGYIQLSAAGLGAGTGMYVMAADQLQRYRQAVDAERTGVKLAELVEAARRSGIAITAHGSVKTAPRGYPKEHPRLDLLCLKGLIAWKQWPVAPWLGSPKAKTRLVQFFRSSRPVTEWLDLHVGPSTAAQPGRR
jgi:uncharacterized protein (TIGR02453 family)